MQFEVILEILGILEGIPIIVTLSFFGSFIINKTLSLLVGDIKK